MTRYASKTAVTVDRSRAQIERLLERYGASSFMYGWENEKNVAVVAFKYGQWTIQFKLPMPLREDYLYTPTGQERYDSTVDKEYDRAKKQRWRALHLVIQAKLEAVECEITTFEEEFLAHIVTPGGLTVGEHVLPKLEEAALTGVLPKALISGI